MKCEDCRYSFQEFEFIGSGYNMREFLQCRKLPPPWHEVSKIDRCGEYKEKEGETDEI